MISSKPKAENIVAETWAVWNQARVIKLNRMQPGRLLSSCSFFNSGRARLMIRAVINRALAADEIFRLRKAPCWNSGNRVENQSGCH